MDTDLLWKKTLDEIEVEVSPNTFVSFFKKTQLMGVEDTSLIISCPNGGVGFVLKNKYKKLIVDVASKYLNHPINNISFQNGKPDNNKRDVGPLFSDETRTKEELITISGLSNTSTFENFAVSVSNQMAHATALAVANNPGNTYNPLFIWGGVGVGKTHLLNAIGKKIINNTSLSVLYCSTEDFTNALVYSIRNKKTDLFRKKYRKTDVLLLDDIQFISEREFVQEELFNTFNKLRDKNKQIVFTSDKPPKFIKKIEKRLVSRFLSGLVVDIQTPDFELKTAILLIKTREIGLDIDIETAKIIAANIEEIREIEGFLMKLVALKQIGTVITKDLVEKLLVQNQTNRQIKYSAKEIIRVVAKETGVRLKDIKDDNRKQNIVQSRHLIMYLLKTLTNLPYEDIAHLLGKKDHTTVMHGVQKIINEIPNSEALRKKIESIKSIFV
jgi:chromosomal replication initiator protein